MSMISEQVKRLRKLANQWKHNDVAGCNLIFEAADTIEALSAKVRAADRPELVYCKDCRHKFTCGMRVQYVKREQNSITVGSYMVDYCSHGERKEQSDE